jgi:hypothetical protein
MQIKLFTIPILGGEKLNEELNLFLRSKKVSSVCQRKFLPLLAFISQANTFCFRKRVILSAFVETS